MTVQELIDALESFDGEAEVRFLAQPSWPFEYTIANVAGRPTSQTTWAATGRPRPNASCSSRGGKPATATSAPSTQLGTSGSRARRHASHPPAAQSSRSEGLSRIAASSSPRHPAS
jgi:hypothetical protein